MASIHLIGLAGSLRKASTNRGLLRAAQASLPEGVTMEIADLTDIPFYNQDITEKPESVKRVLAQIAAADALVLASTEYNYSMAPALKNILDWASREPNKTSGGHGGRWRHGRLAGAISSASNLCVSGPARAEQTRGVRQRLRRWVRRQRQPD